MSATTTERFLGPYSAVNTRPIANLLVGQSPRTSAFVL